MIRPSAIHRMVRLLTLAAAAILVNVAACGTANAQLGPMYAELLNQVQQQAISKLMAQMGLSVEGAVVQSTGATQAEILKGVMVNKAVLEGIEMQRQKEQFRRDAQDTADSLRQPANTCQTIAVQGALGPASQTGRARVGASQSRFTKKFASNTNTLKAVEEAHKASNEVACTAAEQNLGVCKLNTRYEGLAGADQNAAFLFHGSDGSATYDGPRDGAQSKTADSYIDRVAGIPPEQLRAAEYAKNPATRAYVELLRRYKAVLTMTAYSLNQIKEAHVAQPGLGTDTTMATVKAPNFAPNKADMSMLEAVQRFVATKFSPESIRDAGTATNPNLILRDMAQMSAFQLWIEQQTMHQDARTEALMAHQLALLTEKTLRPQLDAQRMAASRSAATARQ